MGQHANLDSARHGRRAWLLLGVLAMPIAPGAAAQTVDTDSLREAYRQQIAAERSSVARAAEVFLNSERPATERLEAVRGVAVLLDSEHQHRAAEISLDAREPTAVRARAVPLTGVLADSDSLFLRAAFRAALNDETPLEVRSAFVVLFGSLFVASQSKHLFRGEFIETFRGLAEQPEARLAQPAVSVLAAYGDEATLQGIAEGLRSGRPPAGLAQAQAVALLGINDPRPWYPTIRSVFLDPPDRDAMIQAMRLLGGDPESRQELIGVLRDPQQPTDVRKTALGALLAGDANVAEAALPVVSDEGAPANLRVTAILAVEQRRTTRAQQVIATRAPDEFDRVVERLADRSRSADVRAAARKYLERTRNPK